MNKVSNIVQIPDIILSIVFGAIPNLVNKIHDNQAFTFLNYRFNKQALNLKQLVLVSIIF